MTNPAQSIRMLITYGICIPLAIFIGFILTEVGNNPDYSNLFVIGTVAAVLLSPIFIKWHYPIMVFGLGCPMYCFFLKGNPPLWQVVTILGLGIALIERTINSEKRFISVPVMTWPLLSLLAMVLLTAELTGGIGLKTLGGGVGGGKKYIVIFLGIAMYFALSSRRIPREKRNLYVILFFLAGLLAFISDLFPVLPSPLNLINLLFPPSGQGMNPDIGDNVRRYGALGTTAFVAATYLLVKYGLGGVVSFQHPFRLTFFGLMFILSLAGGYRTTVYSYGMTFMLLFFLEGLYRTRFLFVALLGLLLGGTTLVVFSDQLPRQIQRTVSFLPVKIDADVKADADGSKLWRETMWRDLWPQVPHYLLLGKGYALSSTDFNYLEHGVFADLGAGQDASQQGLAVAGDYHNGPLSTLIPFGIWGMIGYVWLLIATVHVLWRNYRFGDADIKTVNCFLLVMALTKIFGFFFIFGAFGEDVLFLAKLAGFSVALNWGVCRKPAAAAPAPSLPRSRLRPQPLPA